MPYDLASKVTDDHKYKQPLLRIHHRSEMPFSRGVHAFERALKWFRMTSAESAAGSWIRTRSLTSPSRCWTPASPQSYPRLSLSHNRCARRREWQKLQSTDRSLQTNDLPRVFIILNTARWTMTRPTRTNTPARADEYLKMIESVIFTCHDQRQNDWRKGPSASHQLLDGD